MSVDLKELKVGDRVLVHVSKGYIAITQIGTVIRIDSEMDWNYLVRFESEFCIGNDTTESTFSLSQSKAFASAAGFDPDKKEYWWLTYPTTVVKAIVSRKESVENPKQSLAIYPNFSTLLAKPGDAISLLIDGKVYAGIYAGEHNDWANQLVMTDTPGFHSWGKGSWLDDQIKKLNLPIEYVCNITIPSSAQLLSCVPAYSMTKSLAENDAVVPATSPEPEPEPISTEEMPSNPPNEEATIQAKTNTPLGVLLLAGLTIAAGGVLNQMNKPQAVRAHTPSENDPLLEVFSDKEALYAD